MSQRTTTTRTIIKYGPTARACMCNSDDDNKVKKDSANPYGANWSTARLNSRLLWAQKKAGYGGAVVFGARRPIVVNYLGRVEGQPGGSGRPPRNFW